MVPYLYSVMEKSVLHKADTRGSADHGWLKSLQTFSFGGYYNEDRIHFGALRVLNDDTVDGGRGFGVHPHDNMEIISIPLEGELLHEDSMGNKAVIRRGEIQVMSAGTGIYHTEYNKNPSQPVKFLQIWVFPNQRDVTPRYDQIKLNTLDQRNILQQVVSPNKEDEGVWIYQDAWFHMGKFDQGNKAVYKLKKEGNGIYFFVLKGDLKVNDQLLHTRDGYGIWDIEEAQLEAESTTEFLIMEVLMEVQI